MTPRSAPRSAPFAALALLAVSALVACAQVPLPAWQPPPAPVIEGVAFAATTAEVTDIADDNPVTDPATDPTADPVNDPAAEPAEPSSELGAVPSAAELGLMAGRLRNDTASFAARFVYIPGVPAYNDRVNALLWQAIEATGVWYTPEVFGGEAGLADRGCVAGSVTWVAAEVLSRPETAPTGGNGTAVTCELNGAFGATVLVTLRVVTGSAEAITGDSVQRLMVDVEQGTVAELGERWSAEAPSSLWTSAIELLRQQAGGISTAPIAAPDDTQLGLAKQALDVAVYADTGGMHVTLAPGVTAPELDGLGVEATTEPLELTIDNATAREWSSAQQLELFDATHSGADGGPAPFAGVTAAATSVPIDCALIPCVAITYDDGPSPFTQELLDTLQGRQASATFYMLGAAAQGNPDAVIRAANEGHELGSHTMNHRDLTTLSLSDARAQVLGATDILRQLTGQPVATFRPPFGAINRAVIDAVGMPAVLWSVDTNDWRKPGTDALFERAVGGASPGGIVLFHDTHADTVNAAGDIIDGLRNRGFELVTVTELFGGSVPSGRVSSR